MRLAAMEGNRLTAKADTGFFYNPQCKQVRNGLLAPINDEQRQKLKLQGVQKTWGLHITEQERLYGYSRVAHQFPVCFRQLRVIRPRSG